MSRGKKILIGLGILGGIGLLMPNTGPPPTPMSAEDSAAARAREKADSLRRADVEIEVNAKEAMRQRLKDPGSAQWGTITVHRYSGQPVACGYVNAKNAFGGYVGMEDFLYIGGVAVQRNDIGESRFVKSWNSSCVAPKQKAQP